MVINPSVLVILIGSFYNLFVTDSLSLQGFVLLATLTILSFGAWGATGMR